MVIRQHGRRSRSEGETVQRTCNASAVSLVPVFDGLISIEIYFDAHYLSTWWCSQNLKYPPNYKQCEETQRGENLDDTKDDKSEGEKISKEFYL